MDDSCAVCAETLEWVAYGPCGHREVCSTCVVRLRFICHDRRCCICKTESDVVFVTKASGDYTRMISDFSVLPLEPREGRVGSSYWYHEDTQAVFDEEEHYKMIKEMCRLSCSVCDQIDEQSNDSSKKRAKFRNIEQLKGHLFHRHKLLMCSLCLEGRKVFICEQKLYTRAQLKQHINTGDSVVDGNESDRGGFTGHPMCEFCRTPFYGDNEIYTHMSTDHYTCHICQRQHPGQYDYFKNYDDLEIHFRREHFLCEDESCLAKKFVVFQSEADMKRHNTKEHGGRMSRAQRNAALQIPTSFRYKRSNEQEHRRPGRGRTFLRENSENQLSMAIQASLEMANTASSFHDPTSSSSNPHPIHDHGVTNDDDPIVQSFESMAVIESEPSSRYLQAISKSKNIPLEESSFPPLPGASSINQQSQVSRQVDVYDSPSLMLGNIPITKKKNKRGPTPLTNNLTQSKPAWPALASSRNPVGPTSITHSASAPNLAERSFDSFNSQYPPVSSTQVQKSPIISQPPLIIKDVHTENKSLVEKMRIALEFDEEKYNEFKEISRLYRQGLINTVEYLAYVYQYGLSDLVLDLARLCPDSQKQKELIDTYNANMRSNARSAQNGSSSSIRSSFKKGKGKCLDTEKINSKSSLADNVISSVRELQSYHMDNQIDVEELSRDGYRSSNQVKTKKNDSSNGGEFDQNQSKIKVINGKKGEPLDSKRDEKVGNGKQKKSSKFHRIRLGDGSAEAYLNARSYESEPDPELKEDLEGVPVQGVWRRGGGGQKLFGSGSGNGKKI